MYISHDLFEAKIALHILAKVSNKVFGNNIALM